MALKLDEQILECFYPHMVPMYFTFRKREEKSSSIITAFALDVSGCWFLITSGHVLQDIEKLLSTGWEIEKCRLIDTLTKDAVTKNALPFSYEVEGTVYFDPDKGFDFGIIQVSEFYKLAMQKNGIVAFDETTWRQQPDDVDQYIMIGLPEHLSTMGDERVNLTTLIHVVHPLKEKPRWFEESEIDMFYGRLDDRPDVGSIKGMSGGPILALRDVDGELRYWLHAVQSSWLPDSREISACPVKPFAQFLEQKLKEFGIR